MKTIIELTREAAHADGYSTALDDIINIIKKAKGGVEAEDTVIEIAELCATKIEEKVHILMDVNRDLDIKNTIN